jgi:hypothetical protein
MFLNPASNVVMLQCETTHIKSIFVNEAGLSDQTSFATHMHLKTMSISKEIYMYEKGLGECKIDISLNYSVYNYQRVYFFPKGYIELLLFTEITTKVTKLTNEVTDYTSVYVHLHVF